MTFLLDVSALLALGLKQHEFHGRVAAWLPAQPSPALATCAITELGFVRIASQAAAYGLTISDARALLLQMKTSGVFPFRFLADNLDVSRLPKWVKTPRHITDGHLTELAKSNGAVLATLDAKILGAYLIPQN